MLFFVYLHILSGELLSIWHHCGISRNYFASGNEIKLSPNMCKALRIRYRPI